MYFAIVDRHSMGNLVTAIINDRWLIAPVVGLMALPVARHYVCGLVRWLVRWRPTGRWITIGSEKGGRGETILLCNFYFDNS